jgi:hypothetical protein
MVVLPGQAGATAVAKVANLKHAVRREYRSPPAQNSISSHNSPSRQGGGRLYGLRWSVAACLRWRTRQPGACCTRFRLFKPLTELLDGRQFLADSMLILCETRTVLTAPWLTTS